MLWIIVSVVLIVGLWLGSGMLQGYYDSRNRPTEPMFWCHKHGMFRDRHVLKWLGTQICPRCYNQAMNNAEKGNR